MKYLKVLVTLPIIISLLIGPGYAQSESSAANAQGGAMLISQPQKAKSVALLEEDDILKRMIRGGIENAFGAMLAMTGGALKGPYRGGYTQMENASIEYVVSELKPIKPIDSSLKKAVKTAIKDLASRLRRKNKEIVLISVTPEENSDNMYKVVLEHPMLSINRQGAQKVSQITPQPYGRYTYYIRKVRHNGAHLHGMPVPCQYIVDRVEYFDGSYDTYSYMQNLAETGPEYLGIEKIEQYDKEGMLKAVISYVDKEGARQDRIQTVTRHNEDGTIKYVDEYRYVVFYDDAEKPVYSKIYVDRYKEGDSTSIKERLCVFYYRGTDVGLERLASCTFADGTCILYETDAVCGTDLAQVVHDADGNEIMRFSYDMDECGNITATHVYFTNGILPIVYEGLVDPVDVVVEHAQNNRYKKIAEECFIDVFNPEDPAAAITLVDRRGDNLIFEIKLAAGGYPVYITVDVETQKATLKSRSIKEAIDMAKEEISEKLNPDVVHINMITPGEYIIAPDCVGAKPWDEELIDCNIFASTNKFEMSFYYNPISKDENFVLTSLVNRETGQDLLANAVEHLMKTVNPDEYELVNWNFFKVSPIENPDWTLLNAWFQFKLTDGSFVTVWVDPNTGESHLNFGLQDAIMRTRGDIARKMGKDLEDVHINGVDQLWHILDIEAKPLEKEIPVSGDYDIIWPKYGQEYRITARVDNYTLVMDYTEYGYPWHIYVPYKPMLDPTLMPYPYPYPCYTITLRSFIDNATGRDYVAEAIGQVFDLFNPETNDINVGYWGLNADGQLVLQMSLRCLNGGPYEFIFRGSTIPVTVDLNTGSVTIDQRIVDAVTKAREQISENLGMLIGDVHVNNIIDAWESFVEEGDDGVQSGYLTWIGYRLDISTPQFNLSYTYNVGTGALTLTSLVNRETGADLLGNANPYLTELGHGLGLGRYNKQHRRIHLQTRGRKPDNTKCEHRYGRGVGAERSLQENRRGVLHGSIQP